MVRPCFIVVDREHSSSISTRKLVIETAKFNVITAYSAQEALETFALFPAVTGIILDAAVKDLPCAEVVKRLKGAAPELIVVVVRGAGGAECGGADHYLETFNPAGLLELLQQLKPRETAAIVARDEQLTREGE